MFDACTNCIETVHQLYRNRTLLKRSFLYILHIQDITSLARNLKNE